MVLHASWQKSARCICVVTRPKASVSCRGSEFGPWPLIPGMTGCSNPNPDLGQERVGPAGSLRNVVEFLFPAIGNMRMRTDIPHAEPKGGLRQRMPFEMRCHCFLPQVLPWKALAPRLKRLRLSEAFS